MTTTIRPTGTTNGETTVNQSSRQDATPGASWI